jgi:hypothetical protein
MRSPRDANDVRQAWKNEKKLREQLQSALNQIEIVTRTVEKMRRRILGGASSPSGSGWQWQTPKKELDGTILIPGPNSKGISTAVYISPQNPLVTIGATQLTPGDFFGINVMAEPGVWIAAQDVPPDTGSGYFVPQIPPQLGVPSGSPLSGDADGTNVYWIPIWIYSPC